MMQLSAYVLRKIVNMLDRDTVTPTLVPPQKSHRTKDEAKPVSRPRNGNSRTVRQTLPESTINKPGASSSVRTLHYGSDRRSDLRIFERIAMQ
jgi:hypothetical protein